MMMRSGYLALVCSLAMLAFSMRSQIKEVIKFQEAQADEINEAEITNEAQAEEVECACHNSWGTLRPTNAELATITGIAADGMCGNDMVHNPYNRLNKNACECNEGKIPKASISHPWGGADNFYEVRKRVHAELSKTLSARVEEVEAKLAAGVAALEAEMEKKKALLVAAIKDEKDKLFEDSEKKYGVDLDPETTHFPVSVIKKFDFNTLEDANKKWACCCLSGNAGECAKDVGVAGWSVHNYHHEAPPSACVGLAGKK